MLTKQERILLEKGKKEAELRKLGKLGINERINGKVRISKNIITTIFDYFNCKIILNSYF